MNEFTREIHQTTKSYREITKIRASDAVAGQYAPYIGEVPGQSTRPPTTNLSVVQGYQAPILSPAEVSEGAHLLPASLGATDPVSNIPDTGTNSNEVTALQFFEITHDDELTPTEVDFKGTTKKEQLCRFLITYVWAYTHVLGKPVPSSEHFVSAAKRAGLHDANYRRYFGPTVQQYMQVVEGSYKPKPAGMVEAKRIFGEMRNDSPEGFAYWKGNSKLGRKSPRLNNDEQTRLEEWATKTVEIGVLDVRTLTSTKQAMFAVWSLTKALKVVEAVKPRMAFGYLIKRYTTISGDDRAFVKAFSRKENVRYFGKNSDGLYYLEDAAEKAVESWIGGTTAAVDDTD